MPPARSTQGPPLSKIKQTISPSENEVWHIQYKLLLSSACVNKQLRTIFGFDSPDIFRSAYVKTALDREKVVKERANT